MVTTDRIASNINLVIHDNSNYHSFTSVLWLLLRVQVFVLVKLPLNPIILHLGG